MPCTHIRNINNSKKPCLEQTHTGNAHVPALAILQADAAAQTREMLNGHFSADDRLTDGRGKNEHTNFFVRQRGGGQQCGMLEAEWLSVGLSLGGKG